MKQYIPVITFILIIVAIKASRTTITAVFRYGSGPLLEFRYDELTRIEK